VLQQVRDALRLLIFIERAALEIQAKLHRVEMILVAAQDSHPIGKQMLMHSGHSVFLLGIA
jgi:hypothetical protein